MCEASRAQPPKLDLGPWSYTEPRKEAAKSQQPAKGKKCQRSLHGLIAAAFGLLFQYHFLAPVSLLRVTLVLWSFASLCHFKVSLMTSHLLKAPDLRSDSTVQLTSSFTNSAGVFSTLLSPCFGLRITAKRKNN